MLKTSIDEFLDGEEEYFSVDFDEFEETIESLGLSLYTPEETIKRAYKKINQGEGSYNLIFNNCEHFAFWCKTGVKYSQQINQILKLPKTLIKK
ncbi:lecithin retinol acyltransferase family protein [Paenibacillus sp. BSR1-1]|uniref:lecithin retinol acyltransferase family protein n=1 Tax=Paenibacillus sp. BSR1-1 TaxID=3020845 RepID=UPI00339D5952